MSVDHVGAWRGSVRGIGVRPRRSLKDATHLEIAFATPELRALCEDRDSADRALGEFVAASLRSRLADLMAARSLDEIPPHRGDEMEDQDGFRLVLRGGWEILAVANHRGDLTRPAIPVSRVQILAVQTRGTND